MVQQQRISELSSSGPLQPTERRSMHFSTQTLLNASHNAYVAAEPVSIEPSTSLVLNSWRTSSQGSRDSRVGGTVDPALAKRVWEHALRRWENACLVLGCVRSLRSEPQLT
ncbi:hypothetical protein MRB53_040970 [Persea americana]|nr:hypothetical protein MRB53_040970 [Persea americana]